LFRELSSTMAEVAVKLGRHAMRTEPTTDAQAKHVLIIGIDGLGGAFLERLLHLTPCISKLIESGVSTMRARTVFPSISAPAWCAALCSQGPVESGILNNAWTPEPRWTNPGNSNQGKRKESKQYSEAYMFCENAVCRWSLRKDALSAAGQKITNEFLEFPFSAVDAVLAFPEGIGPDYTKDVAYIFSGSEYCKWHLMSHTLCQGPRKISEGFEGYPFPSVDATLMFPSGVGPSYTRYAAYMFCGDEYCKWDLKTDSLRQPPRKISHGFPGFPFPRVDAVLVFPSGMGPSYCHNKAYMFCSGEYCKWDLETDSLCQGPRVIPDGFPGFPFQHLDGTLIVPSSVIDCESSPQEDFIELFPGSSGEVNAMPSTSGRGKVPQSMWSVAKSTWAQQGIEGRASCALGWDWIHHLCSDCDDLYRGNEDEKAVAAMVDLISDPHPPNLMFVHLDDVDHAGHGHGWGSDAYCSAMRQADCHVGTLLDALDRAGISEETLVMVVADHGGVGCSHGGFTEAELFIPFIVRGGGVSKGLHLPEDAAVSILDVSPTALHALGIAPGRHMRGRVVHEIWDDNMSDAGGIAGLDQPWLCLEICQEQPAVNQTCFCGKCARKVA